MSTFVPGAPRAVESGKGDMRPSLVVRSGCALALLGCSTLSGQARPAAARQASPPALSLGTATDYARDPKQPIDEGYSAKIKQYTTSAEFLSPLVGTLPASKSVPTPAKVLGDVAGAPDMLPYAEEVYRYFRMLEKSTPRVKVYSIGKTEEGREMIAAAIADESLLQGAKENGERLAKLADPRTIGMDDAKARALVDRSYPVYYITGTIHSPETGAPTALMELAYRLAVDDSPYIRFIRSHMIVLITPVVEVDGRDRMVDVYRWHKANPGKTYPRLLYWGHYVAHDNNRDAMAMTLDLTRNVLNTFLDWHAQVLHDLHESVPFLYDNTVGDGPYNAWIDPTLADEWAELGWNNVAQMQTLGMPGVFTHGNFDTWSPGYLMFLAGMHNGISRLYETFGNGGADTERRVLRPEEYSRTWFRQNPPEPIVTWSQRDNNNYEETALLTTLAYFSEHTHHFLENFYAKSKRATEKPSLDGPAAYVLPADPAEANRQAHLLEVLKLQHVEVQQLTAAVSSALPPAKRGEKPGRATFPAGSYVVRMDQPFSRAADALLDRQFWAPDDPQRHPYDDTGWSFPELFNVHAQRVTDPTLLQAKMVPAGALPPAAGGLVGAGTGAVFALPNTGQSSLLALLYLLKGAHVSVAEKPFDSGGRHFGAGSLLVSEAPVEAFDAALRKLSLEAVRIGAAPDVPMHAAAAPRIAFMHTWLATQTEGWWRYAFDHEGIPFDYINVQSVAKGDDLRAKYDVVIFAPVGRASTEEIVNGLPMWGNALPWQRSELTPNLGNLDATADMRPGLGAGGVEHLRRFVEKGGLLITCEDTAQFAIESGLAPGVSVGATGEARVVGSVLNATFVSERSPVGFGYGKNLAVMSAGGMIFQVSNTVARPTSRLLVDPYTQRPTGRGTVEDSDVPQGRKLLEPEVLVKEKPWEPRRLTDDQTRNNPQVIPERYRPEVILRLTDAKTLLLSGLLDKPDSIAERAIVVDAHVGDGNVLLFANNPVYRGETVGSYPLVFNALMNFGHLSKPVEDAK